MSKKASAIAKRVDPDLSLPAHLQGKDVEGIEDLKKYVSPPRIKIVQKSADNELLERFSLGDVIVQPAQVLVSKYDKDNPEPFLFVPLFFFPEWATWSPIELRGQVPMILERTSDPDSVLAKKAKNPNLRFEAKEYEGRQMQVRHVEHLNFIVVLYDHELGIDPMVLSFQRGEHGSGIRFNSLIKMRRASLFACVFQAQVALRKGHKGEWAGLNITNPDLEGSSPWVLEDEVEGLRKKHLEFKETYGAGLLRVEHEDADTDTDDAAATPESSEY